MSGTSGVLISVCDDPGLCHICGGPWHVQKTVRHHGKTISHGQFEIRETVHVCANRCQYASGSLVTRRAFSLAEHIIPGRTIGYDVMTFVGLQRFVHHRQREEIRSALLDEHGISLSSGEISNIAKLFLLYTRDLHYKHAEQLRDALAEDGGWPLHIDATCEDGRGTLLVALAGWRRWVLGAWKIPTERSDAILPCLHQTVQMFGAPCAVMRDLGRAVTLAANTLLADLGLAIPILACHLHFLKDIGSDLLKPGSGELRSLFKKWKVRPQLRTLSRDLGRKIGPDIVREREKVYVWLQEDGNPGIPGGLTGIATVRNFAQWILDFPENSSGEGFPFDRPYLDFYDRCITVHSAMQRFLASEMVDRQVSKILKRLQRILNPVLSDVPFHQIVRRLRARASLFDELRDALRLVPKSIPDSKACSDTDISIPDAAVKELVDIHQNVDQFIRSLKDRRPERGPAKDTRKAIDLILRHVEDHRHNLWGHAISLPMEKGGGTRLLERTNNILEGFFKGMKHSERRRSGRKVLTQDFEDLPAEAALVYNLKHEDYVAIVCGSLEKLPQAFTKIDLAKKQRTLDNKPKVDLVPDVQLPLTESASLPRADRNLVRTKEMKQRILAIATSRHRPLKNAKWKQSNRKMTL
jgi:hypothetical protein